MNKTSSRIVEIVGPAGAGKTTLCNVLSCCQATTYLGRFPDVRKAAHAPFFIWNSLQVFLATRGLPRRNSRQLTRREVAWLAILNGWPAVLRKESRNSRFIWLDQGPVYLLTETRTFGPEYLRRSEAGKLWRRLYSQWADLLDAIIWLDAADVELLKRIRGRCKEHAVKNESAQTTFEYLASYRHAYEQTLSGLLANHPRLRVLRFDTGQKSPEDIAGRLVLEFGLANGRIGSSGKAYSSL